MQQSTIFFVVFLFLSTIQMEIINSCQHSCDVLHMWNSPTFSREWLCTEEPAGYFGLRGPRIRRKDSSLHPSPHSSDGLNKDRRAQLQTGCMLKIRANLKLSSSFFHVFVLLLIVWATDKDPATTTAERNIGISATVVDRVTSSEAMNRRPNPIRGCVTVSPFVRLYRSYPLLNALF